MRVPDIHIRRIDENLLNRTNLTSAMIKKIQQHGGQHSIEKEKTR